MNKRLAKLKLSYMIEMEKRGHLAPFLVEMKHYHNPYIRNFPKTTYLTGLLEDIQGFAETENEKEIEEFVKMAINAEKNNPREIYCNTCRKYHIATY